MATDFRLQILDDQPSKRQRCSGGDSQPPLSQVPQRDSRPIDRAMDARLLCVPNILFAY